MATLPLTEMVLYKHGVGSFTREGDLTADEVTLTFQRSEINDVLKSLTVLDRAGGQVLAVHYQTPVEATVRLANSSIRLSDAATQRELLRDLRGRQVAVSFEKSPETLETVIGRVIGIDEATNQTNAKERAFDLLPSLSLLVGDNQVRFIPLDALREVTIQDSIAQHDLRFFLDSSLSEDERRSVQIRLSEGQHHLVARYVAPSPTWRVSYRLVAEPEQAGQSSKALLQGWALFDNRLDEDLENVKVTLIAGQPISFIYDLTGSDIPERPKVGDQVRVAPGPVQYSGGGSLLKRIQKGPGDAKLGRYSEPGEVADRLEAMRNRRVPPPAGKGQATDLHAKLYSKVQAELDPSMDTRSPSVESQIAETFDRIVAEEHLVLSQAERKLLLERITAEVLAAPAWGQRLMREGTPLAANTSDAGEFFRYSIAAPVSVKRGGSALVPILIGEIGYERELLYNAEKLPDHPVAALRFTNTTGLTLEYGPITVMEAGEYKGEAVLPFTKDGNQVYLPYAVELGVRVTERWDDQVTVTGLSFEAAFLVYEQYAVNAVSYILENATGRDLTITLEAPIDVGYDLFETPAPDVETATERRWRVAVPARSRVDFERKQRRRVRRQEELRRLRYEQLQAFLANRWLDRATRDRLRAMLDALAEAESLRAEQKTLDTELAAIYARQEQIRLNLNALQATGEEVALRSRLLKQLEISEDRVEQIAERTKELSQGVADTEHRIEQIIDGLAESAAQDTAGAQGA